MKLINQLLDYTKPWNKPDVYLFTGNPIVKQNGAIVMGRGAAKQVRDTYPGIDMQFGQKIQAIPEALIVWVKVQNDQWLGWFKVKHHWQNAADLELIRESCRLLWEIAMEQPDIQFHMNYPGIGNGKLTEHEVGHMIHFLPDNVLIYK